MTDKVRFITDTVTAHTRVAVQVSMGRDSLAVVYTLIELGLLDRATVYWVNTGDAFPETLAIAEKVRELVPHFVEIAGNQPQVVENFGIPTDILSRNCTPIGVMCGQSAVRMQDSYSCCGRVIMGPLHERMLADGITLIIRGQRADDSHKAPVKSGDWEGDIQYLFPVESWSDADIDTYLARVGAPRHACYDHGMTSTPDCMTCSGWWSEARGTYLKACHPEAYEVYAQRLEHIRASNENLIQLFNVEYGGTYGE